MVWKRKGVWWYSNGELCMEMYYQWCSVANSILTPWTLPHHPFHWFIRLNRFSFKSVPQFLIWKRNNHPHFQFSIFFFLPYLYPYPYTPPLHNDESFKITMNPYSIMSRPNSCACSRSHIPPFAREYRWSWGNPCLPFSLQIIPCKQ